MSAGPPGWEGTLPEAVLDAGGETVEVLEAALSRCLLDMSPGDVLHVISVWPGCRKVVPAWCHTQHVALLEARTEGEETRFWLRK